MGWRRVSILILLGGLLPGPVCAEEMTGRQILDQVSQRQETPCSYETQTMTLVDKKGNQEVRQLRNFARKELEGQFKYLIVFLGPPGVKGVALLTWQNKGADDDQWLYLPAYGDKTKRVAKGSRKNYFMGTDFTFEDMVSESLDKFSFERKPDETLDGVAHYVVEITPSDPEVVKESGYKSRTVWVRQGNFFVTRTDYFDRQGKLLKRQTVGDLVNVDGSRWRGNTSKMENFDTGHSTVVRTQARAFEESAAPEENFQQRYILSGQYLR